MLPVGAYMPRCFMRPAHVDPEEAVRAAQDVGARVMVSMRWGTFHLSREPVLEPIERTRTSWVVTGRDPADLWDLVGGQPPTARHGLVTTGMIASAEGLISWPPRPGSCRRRYRYPALKY